MPTSHSWSHYGIWRVAGDLSVVIGTPICSMRARAKANELNEGRRSVWTVLQRGPMAR